MPNNPDRRFIVNESGGTVYPVTLADCVLDLDGNPIINEFQETLVSGTNIKTINNQSLLGSGDISISGGSSDMPMAEEMPPGEMLPNVYYRLGEFDGELDGTVTFTMSNEYDDSIVNVWVWSFSTSATAPTIVWPEGIIWPDDTAPEIDPLKLYEITVVDYRATYVVWNVPVVA